MGYKGERDFGIWMTGVDYNSWFEWKKGFRKKFKRLLEVELYDIDNNTVVVKKADELYEDLKNKKYKVQNLFARGNSFVCKMGNLYEYPKYRTFGFEGNYYTKIILLGKERETGKFIFLDCGRKEVMYFSGDELKDRWYVDETLNFSVSGLGELMYRGKLNLY